MQSLFIDENKSGSYTLVAAGAPSERLLQTRQSIAQLRKPGQRRVHFVKESDSRRRLIISRFVGWGLQARIYSASGLRESEARGACLSALAEDVSRLGAYNLTLERDESIERRDRQVLFEALKRASPRGEITYRHDSSRNEPMLWAPDAVAWCFSRGGEWRSRIAPIVISVRRLEW